MKTIDIILGAAMLLVCLIIVILGLATGKNNTNSMTTAITGGSGESHFSKNEGRTKEAIMSKAMAVLMVILFGLTLALTIMAAWR
jgi:preprotein translocase subunit SecG